MITSKQIIDRRQNTGFLTTRSKLHSFLFCFLHPVLILVSGYSMVRWPLPALLKTGLFSFVCLATAWLVYRVLMQPSVPTGRAQ